MSSATSTFHPPAAAQATHPFDREIALAPDGDGFTAALSADWSGPAAPLGGMSGAVLVHAMRTLHADDALAPAAFHARYLRSPAPGPVRVEAAPVRAGRRTASLEARLLQNDKTCVEAHLTLVAPAAFASVERSWTPPPPDAPAFSATPLPPSDGPWPPHAKHMEWRPVLGAPFSGAAPETAGWLAFDGARPLDAEALTFFADAWYPSPIVRWPAWYATPTLDLTVHFHRAFEPTASPEPVLVRFAAPMSSAGQMTEDGMIWSSGGELLASSHQSALVIEA